MSLITHPFLCLPLLILTFVSLATGHGYIRDPIARTAIHLRPDIATSEPYQLDYSGQQCSSVQQDINYTTCGRCGEAPGLHDNSQGGIYYKGIVVKEWGAGEIVEVISQFEAGHYGHFQIELCPQELESDDCFQKLPIISASETIRDSNRVCVPYNSRPCGNLCADLRTITAKVKLPDGVTCDRCTIRWTYRTSYPGRPDWDICDNPNPTQTFRNCADVRIQ